MNGTEFFRERIPDRMLLVDFIRDQLNLTGTHIGCVEAKCGACTVLLNDFPVKSCTLFAAQVVGSRITTIEGISEQNKLHPLQEAFLQKDAIECGFCSSGMIMSAYALVESSGDLSEEDVKDALSGNLCRCTGYLHIVEAVLSAKKALSK